MSMDFFHCICCVVVLDYVEAVKFCVFLHNKPMHKNKTQYTQMLPYNLTIFEAAIALIAFALTAVCEARRQQYQA